MTFYAFTSDMLKPEPEGKGFNPSQGSPGEGTQCMLHCDTADLCDGLGILYANLGSCVFKVSTLPCKYIGFSLLF